MVRWWTPRGGWRVSELLPGQRHESLAAEGLLSGVSFGALLADRGFDNDALRDSLDDRGAEAVRTV